jgi:hypothetical protein
MFLFKWRVNGVFMLREALGNMSKEAEKPIGVLKNPRDITFLLYRTLS